MKIGISAFAWTSQFKASHLDLLPMVRRLGLSGMEVPMFDPAQLPASAIRAAFERNDLECTVCAILPASMNPISPELEIRRQAVDHLIRCIETASAMGAKLLGGPLFAPIGYLPDHRPTEDEWSWAVAAFQEIAPVLDRCDITMSIEPVNRSETFFIRTAQDAAVLCERIGHPRIGVTIDTFHANIEEQSLCGAIRSLGPRLFHLHASENDRGPLGRGHIPFADIMAALNDIHYTGYLMIEGFGYSQDEKHSPGYLWADPDVSPESMVSESSHFLAARMSQA